MIWIYTIVTRLLLTNGCTVWWQRSDVMSTRQSTFQILACLPITGAMKATPSLAMEILLRLPLNVMIGAKAEA
jgi:hypothetical protein